MTSDAPDTTLPDMPKVPRRQLVWLGIAWGVLITAGSVGAALWAVLLERSPLLLIGLSPLGRHLLLVVPKVELAPFVAVGALRKLAFTSLWYLMGRTYGELGIRWFEGRYARLGRFVRAAERLFSKAAGPLLFISPNALFAVLAGAAGMRALLFVPLALGGHAMWLVVTYEVGKALEVWIELVNGWIAQHVAALTVGSIVVVVLLRALRSRRKRNDLLPEL